MAEPVVVKRKPRTVRRPNTAPSKTAHGGASKRGAIRLTKQKASSTKNTKAKKSLFSFGKKKANQTNQAAPKKAENHTQALGADGRPMKNENILIREQLHGVARLMGDRELDMLVKMDTSVAYMQKRMQNRFNVSIICLCVGLVAAMVVRSSFGPLLGMGLGLAGLTWYMDQRKTLDFYRQFQLKRQIAFSQFTRLAAAYLPELKQGTNLYSVFERIVPRMEDERDTIALQKLMIDMQADPNDSGPFLEFAHDFSVSDRAELIMLTIQQMYLGDVEDENIRSLADGANEDMLKQSDTIIAFKLKRFDNLTARIGICAMVPIIGYFVLLVSSTVGTALGQISSVTN